MKDLVYCPTDEDVFDNIEHALEFVRDVATDEEDAIGWVIGVYRKIRPKHLRFISVEDLIIDMQNKASYEFSENAEDYLNDVERNEEKIKSLNSVLEKWFDENSSQPTFWHTGDEVGSIVVDAELLEKHGIKF